MHGSPNLGNAKLGQLLSRNFIVGYYKNFALLVLFFFQAHRTKGPQSQQLRCWSIASLFQGKVFLVTCPFLLQRICPLYVHLMWIKNNFSALNDAAFINPQTMPWIHAVLGEFSEEFRPTHNSVCVSPHILGLAGCHTNASCVLFQLVRFVVIRQT